MVIRGTELGNFVVEKLNFDSAENGNGSLYKGTYYVFLELCSTKSFIFGVSGRDDPGLLFYCS